MGGVGGMASSPAASVRALLRPAEVSAGRLSTGGQDHRRGKTPAEPPERHPRGGGVAYRLHAAGLPVIGSAVGPFRGTAYDGYDNARLLGDTHPFDAVADVAAAIGEPGRPDRIRPEHDSGDGLHVNHAAAKAIADAVDVTLLER